MKRDAVQARLEHCAKKCVHVINHISIKNMTVCAALLLIAALIPLLLLGKYNVMCIDDYDYGRRVHDTWLATGSVWQSVCTAARQTWNIFLEWQGTYVSCFLMALCPMNFYYESAFLVPVIMIGMFCVSTYLFGRQILVKWLGCGRQYASFTMFVLLFMFYQVMEAPFEGIYWYNGSTHYIFMQSLLFLMVTFVSQSIWAEKKTRAVLCCVLSSVGGILVGGGNLISALQAEILLVLLLLYVGFSKREKMAFVLPPFFTFTAGFLCNILAPGNTVRAGLDTDEGYAALVAIVLSFYYAVVFMIHWSSSFVILIWLALLPVFWQMGKKSSRTFAHPVWVSIGAFCILAAMFTPTLYAVGMVGLARVDNIIQMVYYLCLFFVTLYWFGWISHRKTAGRPDGPKERSAGEKFGLFLESTKNMMTVSFFALVLLMWILTADKNTYTGISALRSLAKGEGAIYYEEAMERHELYTDESITDVTVKPFSTRPFLFDFDDLTEESGNWLNLAVTGYYHKNSVRLVE